MASPEPAMPSDAAEVVLVSCTHPAAGAQALATALVTGRLAACVQVLPGVRSVYRWQGAVETSQESRLDIKTTADRLPALIAEIRRLHPYELPEIVAVANIAGSEAYLAWVREQCAEP